MVENGELGYHGCWATNLNQVKSGMPKNQTSNVQALISKAVYNSTSMMQHDCLHRGTTIRNIRNFLEYIITGIGYDSKFAFS